MTVHELLKEFSSDPETVALLQEPELAILATRNPSSIVSAEELEAVLALCDRLQEENTEALTTLDGFEKTLNELGDKMDAD